jgi:hypothetical protein
MINSIKTKNIIKLVMNFEKILLVLFLSVYFVQADNCPTAQYWQYATK